MTLLTDTDLKTIAEQLGVMKRRVLDEIRSASADVDASAEPLEREVKDHADDAEVERDGDVRFAEIEIDRARLHDIELAEQRIADGRYGTCVDCGEAIPRERLLAQPIAFRCAACQTAAEARHHR